MAIHNKWLINVVEAPEFSTESDTRYKVIENKTGNTLADANGRGYKTKRAAFVSYGYLSKQKNLS